MNIQQSVYPIVAARWLMNIQQSVYPIVAARWLMTREYSTNLDRHSQ